MKWIISLLFSILCLGVWGQNTHNTSQVHAFFGYYPINRDTLHLTYSQIVAAPFLRSDLGSVEEFYVTWSVHGGDVATPVLVKGNRLSAPVLSALLSNKNRRTIIHMEDIRFRENDGIMRVLNPVTIEMVPDR